MCSKFITKSHLMHQEEEVEEAEVKKKVEEEDDLLYDPLELYTPKRKISQMRLLQMRILDYKV